jgi:uncharacterized protein YjbI with pentapeptide repeats
MTKLTSTERQKIQEYTKNGIDISSLLIGKDIKGENLSRAVIKFMQREHDDITGCNFSYATIGNTENKIVYFLRTKMQNCSFEGAKFISTTWIRNCDAKNCNFKSVDGAKIDYRYTDFTGSSFCEAIITISTKSGMGCKFDAELLTNLTQYWGVNVKITRKEGV